MKREKKNYVVGLMCHTTLLYSVESENNFRIIDWVNVQLTIKKVGNTNFSY